MTDSDGADCLAASRRENSAFFTLQDCTASETPAAAIVLAATGRSGKVLKHTMVTILIAENNYLIAMEVERIITETCKCRVTICRRDELPGKLAELAYDLAFVDAAATHEERARQASAVHQAGVSLVFMWANQEDASELHSLNPTAIFEKPFNEARIKSFVGGFCYRAARKGPDSPCADSG
jgi:hypothetical protein